MRRMQILGLALGLAMVFCSTGTAGLYSVSTPDPAAGKVAARHQNPDGSVEVSDYLQMSDIGKSACVEDETIPAIPEPATFLLVGIGVFGTGIVRKHFGK